MVNWSRLWPLSIPPKIKHFVWRIFKEQAPTKFNLRWRGMLIEDACVFCGKQSETTTHVLRDSEWI